MSIDEAIAHAREVVKKKRETPISTIQEEIDFMKCAREHEQLAEWLEELKDYRDKNKMVVRIDVENMDSIKDKIEELSKYAENQYGKGIDDYKNRIKEELDRFEVQNLDICVLYDLMDRKAERLKAGGENDD